jgi:integrase/recombinase XerD
MALQLYRRHTKDCVAARLARGDGANPAELQADRSYRRCKCPIQIEGTLRLEGFIRKSTGESSWEKAEDLKRAAEDKGCWGDASAPSPEPKGGAGPKTLNSAIEAFETDARARGLRAPTMKKYRVVFAQLRAYAQHRGYQYLARFDVNAVREFHCTWTDSAISALKKLERLRAFFRFCQDSGWLDGNPAAKLKAPEVGNVFTPPFTQEEMIAIFGAFSQMPTRREGAESLSIDRLRALVLLMRYSGLRISDAISFHAEKLTVDGEAFLRQAKTGEPVYVPLPPFVVKALRALPTFAGGFFFWSRQKSDSKIETAAGNARRSLRKVFKLASVTDGHPHRFRDTFAVELLNHGTPIEDVAALLGHADVGSRKSITPPG